MISTALNPQFCIVFKFPAVIDIICFYSLHKKTRGVDITDYCLKSMGSIKHFLIIAFRIVMSRFISDKISDKQCGNLDCYGEDYLTSFHGRYLREDVKLFVIML